MKEKVIKWFEDGQDFDKGIALLSETGKHKQLIRSISGRPWRYAKKLEYELIKAAGVSLNMLLEVPKSLEQGIEDDPIEPKTDNVDATGEIDITEESEPDLNVLPIIMQRVVKEHSELYNTRARLHQQMAAMPETNSPEIVSQRKVLSDSIALLSPRIELLFAAKELFYSENILPIESILFPTPEEIEESKTEDLPADAESLKRMKKNLQSSNVKDQNQLDFQSEKREKKPNQMADGAKRMKLEKRINERKEKIEAIDIKLLELC